MVIVYRIIIILSKTIHGTISAPGQALLLLLRQLLQPPGVDLAAAAQLLRLPSWEQQREVQEKTVGKPGKTKETRENQGKPWKTYGKTNKNQRKLRKTRFLLKKMQTFHDHLKQKTKGNNV
jgi:hypothetical protein